MTAEAAADLFSRTLVVLRDLPLWVLAGVSAAAIALLDAPDFGEADLTDFRHGAAPYIWAVAVSFGVLAAFRLLDLAARGLNSWHRRRSFRSLSISLVSQQSHWGQPKQPDGRTITALAIWLKITNLLQEPTKLHSAQLVRPRASRHVVQTIMTVGSAGYDSGPDIPIPRRTDAAVVITIAIDRPVGKRGHPLDVKLVIVDQFCNRNPCAFG